MAAKGRIVRVEVDGLGLSIDRAALEDIETLDMLDDIAEGNALKVKKLMVRIFGDDGWSKVREHLADGDGRVGAESAAKFLVSVLEAFGAKN